MKRGEVWWVRFDPAIGSEIKKTRPAVIVSTDMANRNLGRMQVVPLSTRTDKFYPSEARVAVAGQDAKAMADQIATVDKQRFGKKLGQLSDDDMRSVERVVRVQLQLGDNHGR